MRRAGPVPRPAAGWAAGGAARGCAVGTARTGTNVVGVAALAPAGTGLPGLGTATTDGTTIGLDATLGAGDSSGAGWAAWVATGLVIGLGAPGWAAAPA